MLLLLLPHFLVKFVHFLFGLARHSQSIMSTPIVSRLFHGEDKHIDCGLLLSCLQLFNSRSRLEVFLLLSTLLCLSTTHTLSVSIKDAVQKEPLQLFLENVSLDDETSSNSQRTIVSDNVIPDESFNPLLQQQSTESTSPEPQLPTVLVAEGEVKGITKCH